MKEFVQEIVSKRFTQLPSGVQDVILSDSLADSLLLSMQTAGLSEEKLRECNQQATLVLVGLATTKEFKTYVTDELHLDAKTAQTLFDDISRHVFIPVRDTLLKAFDEVKTTSEDTKPTQETHNDPYREQLV